MSLGGVQKGMIHRNRDVILVEGRVQTAFETAGFGIKEIAADLSGQSGPDRVEMVLVGGDQAVVGVAPNPLVR